MHYQNDDESIAKSYNQKVKNDTNFLAKNKVYYEDSQPKDYDSYHLKKEQEILYNLQLRVSYKNNISFKPIKTHSFDNNEADLSEI